MFSLLKRAAKKRNPLQRENRLEFRVFVLIKSLIIFALGVYTVCTILTLAAISETDAAYLPLIFLVMILGTLLGAPVPVVLDEHGI